MEQAEMFDMMMRSVDFEIRRIDRWRNSSGLEYLPLHNNPIIDNYLAPFAMINLKATNLK